MLKKLRFTLIYISVLTFAILRISANGIKPLDNNIEIDKPTSALPIKALRTFKGLEKFDTSTATATSVKSIWTADGSQFSSVDSLQNKKWESMANNTFATLEQTRNYVDILTKDGLSELPVATRPKEISNITYTVGVARAIFKPTFTELIMFLKVDTPKGTLILGANNIKLSHSGGIIGEARLSLISQFVMNFDNDNIKVTLKGNFQNPATYALVDCSGF